MKLMQNQTADGSSSWVSAIPDAYNGIMNIYVAGNLGGGTLTIESLSPDGASVVPLSGGVFSSPEMKPVALGSTTLRATLVGATAPNVSVWIEPESVSLRKEIRSRT